MTTIRDLSNTTIDGCIEIVSNSMTIKEAILRLQNMKAELNK